MTEKLIEKADFRLFLVLWNQQQNFKTPLIHLEIAVWLEESWNAGDKRLLFMAFRSAGKSSLIGIFAAWLLYRNPNLRIMVLAADLPLAKKMVRNVKRIIEKHPLTKHLKPKKADQWASDRFTITRDTELRDPSVMARGISANITGSRADIVICDDVEVPNTCDTAQKREDLRERLAEISYVLTSDGTQLYVGTPHDYFSIYADVARDEIGEDRPFLNGFSRYVLPILNEFGESSWPEKYMAEDIDRIRISSGPNKFESQMMLKCVNIIEGRLDPSLLQMYSTQIEYDRMLGHLFLGRNKMVGASAWWDPAFGSAHGDGSVLAIIYADQLGNYFLHRLEYLKTDPNSSLNEADQQSQKVAELAKKFHLPCLTVEMNGIGRFLPNILRNALSEAHCPTHVQEEHSRKPKAQRILEGFDAVMAAQRLFVHENVLATPFIMEMREWTPKNSKSRDDGLDAVAGALSRQPDRMERNFGKGSYSWMQGKSTQTAKSDFKI